MVISDFPLSKFFVHIGVKDGCEKIVFGGNDMQSHYTFMIKRGEGVYEGHITPETKTDPTNKREVLFRMKIEDFHKFLISLEQAQFQFFQYYAPRKINVGKMKKYKWVVVPLHEDTSKTEGMISSKKGGRHLRFKKDIDLSALGYEFKCPCCLTETVINKALAYSYVNGKVKPQGLIFKHPNARAYYFISNKLINRMNKWILAHAFKFLKESEFENKKAIIDFICTKYEKVYLANHG